MVWNEAQRLNCDIFCLQETHFTAQKLPVFQHKKFPHVYQANASSKKGGVLIVVKDSVAFMLVSQQSVPQECYLILVCQINNVLYSIISVYLLNVRPISSLRKIWKKVQPICQGHIILCGDLNAIVDRKMDTSQNSSHRATLTNFLDSTSLFDVWRCQHATEKDFTFFSHVHKIYTRIDFFLTHKFLLLNIQRSEIGNITWSDHEPVSVTVREGSWGWEQTDGATMLCWCLALRTSIRYNKRYENSLIWMLRP